MSKFCEACGSPQPLLAEWCGSCGQKIGVSPPVLLSNAENLQNIRAPEITDLASQLLCKKANSRESPKETRCRPRNYSWAELIRRVFDQ